MIQPKGSYGEKVRALSAAADERAIWLGEEMDGVRRAGRNRLTDDERAALGPPRVLPPRESVQPRAARQSLLGGLRSLNHWTDRIACRGHAGLFDEQGDDERPAASAGRHLAAREICAGCPVWLLCGLDAYDRGASGIRAGVLFDGHLLSVDSDTLDSEITTAREPAPHSLKL